MQTQVFLYNGVAQTRTVAVFPLRVSMVFRDRSKKCSSDIGFNWENVHLFDSHMICRKGICYSTVLHVSGRNLDDTTLIRR